MQLLKLIGLVSALYGAVFRLLWGAPMDAVVGVVLNWCILS